MINLKLGDLVFPINPEEIFFEREGSVKEFDVLSFGTVLSVSNPKPISFTLKGFFSNNSYPFSIFSSNSLYNIKYIENIFVNKISVDFSIYGNVVPRSFNVIVTKFSYGEKADSYGDVYFSISLMEYKERKPFIVDKNLYVKKVPVVSNPISNNDSAFREHIVKRGDTLWDLSIKYLGDPMRYVEIANINNIKNPRLLQIGQVLKIPW